MSYTTLYAVLRQDGPFEAVGEYRNSHGAAPMIWEAMARKYLSWEDDRKTFEERWRLTWEYESSDKEMRQNEQPDA